MSDEPTERDVEALAEALHRAVCPPSGDECCWLNDESGDPACLPEYTRPLAQTLASDWYAERIAEARREGAAEALEQAARNCLDHNDWERQSWVGKFLIAMTHGDRQRFSPEQIAAWLRARAKALREDA